MTDNTNSQNIQPSKARLGRAEDAISLLDILLVIARNRRLIGVTVALFGAIGLLVAIFSQNEYTASAKVIREAPAEGGSMSGGLAALRGFGINVGGGATGLTPEAYPEIVSSREVRLAVVRDTFSFSELARPTTFVDYFSEAGGGIGSAVSSVKRYTIGLPGLILSSIRSDPASPGAASGAVPAQLSESEEEAMKLLGSLIATSVNPETGLMTVRATTGDPYVAAQIVGSVLEHMAERVRQIRTEKARMNLEFMRERFDEARVELEKAEEELIRFHDRNFNPQTAQLRTELDRLQRKVSFKSQLYSELQTQVTQAEIELQRSEPVVTVLEEPAPPTQRSGPKRSLIVVLSVILGAIIGLGGAFVRNAFQVQSGDADEREKMAEVKQNLMPNWIRHRKEAGAVVAEKRGGR